MTDPRIEIAARAAFAWGFPEESWEEQTPPERDEWLEQSAAQLAALDAYEAEREAELPEAADLLRERFRGET
jgi:hypothetical protein